MRSYFKVWRSGDFKTIIVDVPPGTDILGFEKLALLHTDRENLPFIHNFFTSIPNWIGYDDSLSIPIIGPISGLTLANTVYNFVPYEDHPLN